MATTTAPTGNGLSAEEKAARELAANLLDAERNFTRNKTDACKRIEARTDAALKELSKATTPDQLVALAKNLATAKEQAEKENEALVQLEHALDKRIKQFKKDSPKILLAIYEERYQKLKEEAQKYATEQKPLLDEIADLEKKIDDLKPATATHARGTTPASSKS